MKLVLVPQEDIDKIEEVRQGLWQTINTIKIYLNINGQKGKIPLDDYLDINMTNITGPMWCLTHRKYKQPFLNKLKIKLKKLKPFNNKSMRTK